MRDLRRQALILAFRQREVGGYKVASDEADSEWERGGEAAGGHDGALSFGAVAVRAIVLRWRLRRAVEADDAGSGMRGQEGGEDVGT